VKEAVKNPRDISMELVNAQQARRALDYLVGFNLSPLLWKKIRRGLSAGRVQSPALRLIVEREIEIDNFKTREYWSVHFDAEKRRPPSRPSSRTSRARSSTSSRSAAPRGTRRSRASSSPMQGLARVTDIEKKRKLRSPAPPFTTSTLQQEACASSASPRPRDEGGAKPLRRRVPRQGGHGPDHLHADRLREPVEGSAHDIRGYITKNFGADYLRSPRSPTRAPPRTRRRPTRPSGRPRSRDAGSVAPYLNDSSASSTR